MSSSSLSNDWDSNNIPGVRISKDEKKKDTLLIKINPSLFQQQQEEEAAERTATTNVAILDRQKEEENDENNNNDDYDYDEEVLNILGFDKQTFDIYLPVAKEIEKNATTTVLSSEEKLNLFRSSPIIKQHFQMKITSLIIQPIKDIQELEYMKQQYLRSSSRIEKENLKRRIDQLQRKITTTTATNNNDSKEMNGDTITTTTNNNINNNENDGTSSTGTTFLYSDTIHYKELQPLSNEERKKRLHVLQKLPDVLQSVYKKRYNLECTDDIELAVELDYYEQQIQLLEQIQLIDMDNIESMDERTTLRNDIIMAIESLPTKTVQYLATKTLRLQPGNYTIDDMIIAYNKKDDFDFDNDDTIGIELGNKVIIPNGIISKRKKNNRSSKNTNVLLNNWKSLFSNGISMKSVTNWFDTLTDDDDDDIEDLPEYDDIGFIDRSRYVEEFYPAIARMEGKHPILDEVNEFITTVLDKKIFMVTSKPERVIGGWYVRGRNLLLNNKNNDIVDNENEDSITLVDKVQKSLSLSTTLKDKIQFFYIPDPSPLTDEDYEMEYTSESLFVVTRKEDPPIEFYNYANPYLKGLVSLMGLLSIIFVSVAAVALQPGTQYRLDEMAAAASSSSSSTTPTDLTFLTDTVFQIMISMIAMQVAHELGHRIVAWKDKFQLGFPTLVPSVQLGLIGAITPFRSPPPNLQSMFDVAIAGPLFGFVLSFMFLFTGLDITSHLTQTQQADLPVFPSYVLRASELGGGLVEFFLGKGILTQGMTAETLLPLHPFAIAGFTGILANALALLPLGNTDGGRIAVSMFGRRGAYVVKTFTTILLCLMGLFGLDNSRLFLVYVFYTQVWQRELESPALNEVEELDYIRGAIGIAAALIVTLTLIPMQ